MRLLKVIFNFYLDASIHVSLAVVSLVGITAILLNIPLSSLLVGFIFFGTIVCYNFVKYGVEAKKYLIVSNIYHKNIQIFSFLSFSVALYFLFQLDIKVWMAVGGLGLIASLYAIPLLPKTKNLRSLGGFKIYIVALVWVGFTVLLPILDAKISLNWDFWVMSLQRFILVLILILPFEIRDLQWDDKHLKTLPQVFGVQRTKVFGGVLTVLLFALTFLKDDVTQTELLMRLVLSIILLLLFLSNSKMQARYLASFWVEGIPVFWYGLFLIADRLF